MQVVRRFDQAHRRRFDQASPEPGRRAHRRRFDKTHRRLRSPQVFVRSRLRRARLVQTEVRRLAQRILTQVDLPLVTRHPSPRTGTGTHGTGSRRRRVPVPVADGDRHQAEGCQSPEPVPCELSLDFVGDRRMRRLNREYRGRDLPTDVLAFSPSPFPLPPSPGERTKVRGAANVLQRGNPPALLGDVVISVPTTARQAAALGHSVEHELAVLLIHGILHLVGYDHERGEREARRMRRKERAILQALGPIPKLVANSKYGSTRLTAGGSTLRWTQGPTRPSSPVESLWVERSRAERSRGTGSPS